MLCPICNTDATTHVKDSPYWDCRDCGTWFQMPLPPKVYIGEHEPDPLAMPEQERLANASVAGHLFEHVMKKKPGPTLDIGAKWPFLAHCLSEHGCDAFALDAESIPHQLDVHSICGDFEKMPVDDLRIAKAGRYSLITLVHTFEHFYDPVAAMRKLRDLISGDGRLFIRMPDHSVDGWERDLVPSHYKIHPFFYSLGSILQICANLGNEWEIESATPLEPGQVDIVLRPIRHMPSLTIGTIAKNEQRDLPKMIDSVATIANQLVIVDTGSTDETEKVTRAAAEKHHIPLHFETYLEASEQDEAGDWKLWDFSKARNHMLAECERHRPEWIMWMDADDVLDTPRVIRRAMYWSQRDCFGLWMRSGGQRWVHYRMWKRGSGVRFHGGCHEWPKLDGLSCSVLMEGQITHDAAHTFGETGNARNLRILMREWEQKADTRTAFYIATTHKDGGRPEEAATWFRKRIALGEGYRDEWLFSHLYLARSLRTLKRHAEADEVLRDALKAEPGWCEFTMERAFVAYDQGKHDEAIMIAARALLQKPTLTHLWREPTMYRDQPARLISWCYEHMGDPQKALTWAEIARHYIDGYDHEWAIRIEKLKSLANPEPPQAPEIIVPIRPRFGICRPGAIGDIIMTLNLLPKLRELHPEHEIAYFCDGRLAQMDGLGTLIHSAGAAVLMDSSAWGRWQDRLDKAVSLIGYPLAEGYPDVPMKMHLLYYFGSELGIPVMTDLPALTLPLPKMPVAPRGSLTPNRPYVTLQVSAGWSAYKQWKIERWQEVVRRTHHLIDFVQIGERGTPLIERANHAYIGSCLRESIAVIANAQMHVGVDSFGNHLTNYLWTSGGNARRVPGVILWGSTQASAAGYPDNINLSAGLSCQPCFKEDETISRHPRGICLNPPRGVQGAPRKYGDAQHACMAAISVDTVEQAIYDLYQTVA